MNKIDREFWERLFCPKSVAVFGAHPTKITTFANMYLHANIIAGYEGKLFAVGSRGGEVSGMKIYKSLDEINEKIDLACVAVPAPHVIEVLESCLRHKIPGAQVLSAGFSELGTEEGSRLEAQIVALSKKGIRIIGPNCFGIHDPKCGLTIMPGSGFAKKPGPVAFITQSGGQAVDMGYAVQGMGVGLRRIVSFGNGCDVDAAELLDIFADDPECSIIASYLEGVKDGRRFFAALKSAALKKPVIIWKAGLTESGAQAVASHTGSLGGSEIIWEAALKQAGAVLTRSQDELYDAIAAFYFIGKWAGEGIGFVGGGGAMSAAAADAVDRSGFTLPQLSKEAGEKIASLIAHVGTSVKNPIDAGNPVIPPHILSQLLELAAAEKEIDVVLLMQYVHHITFLTRVVIRDASKPLEDISWHGAIADVCKSVREKSGKPVVQILPPLTSETAKLDVEKVLRLWREASHAAGVPTFPSLDRGLKALRHVCDYWTRRKNIEA